MFLTYHVDIVVMGSDWAGSDKFDYLKITASWSIWTGQKGFDFPN